MSRSPVIVSHYADPVKNKNLKESLQALIQKQAVEKVLVPSSLAFYNRLFLVPKPNNRWRPILDLSQLNIYLASASFKMETPETIRLSLQQGEWVTSLDFSDTYFRVPISPRSRKYFSFHRNNQTYQFTSLPFGLLTAPLGYSNPPVPRRLVSESPVPGKVPMSYTDPVGPMSQPRLGSPHVKVRTVSPTGIQLCRLLFRPLSRPGQTHPREVDIPDPENQLPFGARDQLSQAVHVPNWTSDSHGKTGGVGTSSHETYPMAFKEVLACPGISRENDSPSMSVHVHLRWWLDPDKVLKGQPLHPLQHTLQLFTDTSNEGWGAHLGDYTARGLWSKSEGNLLINLLELKAVLLALKQFEQLCWNQTILVCTDNTTVVSYINKEGGMKSGSLCALLWRLLLWCNQREIVLWARHIPGHLNVIADKLSRHKQVIQTEWSLLQEIFDLLSWRWHKPTVDLFATRFNHKLPRFVSPVPDSLAWKVDALSLQWKDLDAHAFPPTALLGQVVSKLLDHSYRRLILIAPGWPNVPWFWDLVTSLQNLPLSLLGRPLSNISLLRWSSF